MPTLYINNITCAAKCQYLRLTRRRYCGKLILLKYFKSPCTARVAYSEVSQRAAYGEKRHTDNK